MRSPRKRSPKRSPKRSRIPKSTLIVDEDCNNGDYIEIYIENCKDQHYTINDFDQLRPNDVIDVVIWDRNYSDHLKWPDAVPNRAYKATDFFQNNRCTIRYLGGFAWEIKSIYDDVEAKTPVEVNVRTFHVGWEWMPFETDGTLVLSDKYENGKIIPLAKPKISNYRKLPKSTRIGWRGPMMLWSKLSSMPDIRMP